jgi:hypothetical protein
LICIYIYGYINSLKDEIKQVEPMLKNMWPKIDDEETVVDINIDEAVIL